MINRLSLSHEQAQAAVQSGDFTPDVLESAENVILILTQSWCPQWLAMKMSLRGLGNGSDDMDLSVITYEYDKSPLFHDFMVFKENTFRNWEVPYVRLYRKGELVGQGNYLPAGRMIETLRKAGLPVS